MDRKGLAILLIIVSFLGFADSIYLTYLHYSSDNSTICNIIGDFQCDIVNKSQFSEMTGILSYFGIYLYLPVPVSAMGAFMFLLFLVIGAFLLRKNQIPVFGVYLRRKMLQDMLFYFSIASFIFSMFLVYVQAFVLRTWCFFCILLDAAIILVLVISALLKFSKI